MNRAFVLGNGLSRKEIPLDKLKNFGKVYGCNALYREYDPDYLIAVDAKMIVEICSANYQLKVPVWTNQNKNFVKYKNLNFFEPSKGWSSGPTALHFASESSYEEIFILGFDYQGVQNKVNNIYADTKNYKKSMEKATYFGNWLRQTTTVIQKNPDIKFIRVLAENLDFVPKEFHKLNNLNHIYDYEFNKYFGLLKK